MVAFDPYILGRRIAAARQLADISQVELGKRSGLNQVTIARIERGRAKGLRVETLVAIADVLNVSVDWLLGGEEEPKAA